MGMLFNAKDCSTCSASVWGALGSCCCMPPASWPAARCRGTALWRFRWLAKVRAAITTDCVWITCSETYVGGTSISQLEACCRWHLHSFLLSL